MRISQKRSNPNHPLRKINDHSRNLHRRRPRHRHPRQSINIQRGILLRQRRKRQPRQSIRNRRLHFPVRDRSRSISNHIRLIHPTDIISRCCFGINFDLRGVEGEIDGAAAARERGGAGCLFQRRDEGEGGHTGFAAAGDDEGQGEVEGVGGGDAGVEGGGVGDEADGGGGAEEGVVAGFDGEDGGGAGDELGVGESEGGGDVDDGADADACDDV